MVLKGREEQYLHDNAEQKQSERLQHEPEDARAVLAIELRHRGRQGGATLSRFGLTGRVVARGRRVGMRRDGFRGGRCRQDRGWLLSDGHVDVLSFCGKK
ncbi:hypothetical protein GCM10010401_16770 [Rarobacter faecitabidus]